MSFTSRLQTALLLATENFDNLPFTKKDIIAEGICVNKLEYYIKTLIAKGVPEDKDCLFAYVSPDSDDVRFKKVDGEVCFEALETAEQIVTRAIETSRLGALMIPVSNNINEPIKENFYQIAIKNSLYSAEQENKTMSKKTNFVAELFDTNKTAVMGTAIPIVKGNNANAIVKNILRPVLAKALNSGSEGKNLVSSFLAGKKADIATDIIQDSVFTDLLAAQIVSAAGKMGAPISDELVASSQSAAWAKLALKLDLDNVFAEVIKGLTKIDAKED